MEITLKVLFPRQIFDLATNFQRKFDDDHCNDVEKQSNFKKFDCLKADKSAFVETLSVSTFYNHYNYAEVIFLENLRGTAIYCGIGIYLEEIKKHLAEAHEAGINAVFTSLQLPESDSEILKHDFPLMCEEAHKYGMLVAADIAPRTATEFGLDLHDIKAIKSFGVDIMRLDGGYTLEETAELSHNEHGMLIMMNASMAENKLKKLCDLGINTEQTLFCHNYYPMRYTGLSPERAVKNNALLHKYGFRVSGFVSGKHHRRLACSIGLPTVEALRDTPLDFTLQAMLFYGFDDLFFGDDLASLEEMQSLVAAKKPMTFRMKLLVDDINLKNWFEGREISQLQGGIPEIVRSNFLRANSMYNGNCEIGLPGLRKKGTVMLGKKALYRYEGEVQIARCDLPNDPDIGIIGQIIDEDLPLLDIFKVDPETFIGPSFEFKIV